MQWTCEGITEWWFSSLTFWSFILQVTKHYKTFNKISSVMYLVFTKWPILIFFRHHPYQWCGDHTDSILCCHRNLIVESISSSFCSHIFCVFLMGNEMEGLTTFGNEYFILIAYVKRSIGNNKLVKFDRVAFGSCSCSWCETKATEGNCCRVRARLGPVSEIVIGSVPRFESNDFFRDTLFFSYFFLVKVLMFVEPFFSR